MSCFIHSAWDIHTSAWSIHAVFATDTYTHSHLVAHLDNQAGGHDFTVLELLALFFLKKEKRKKKTAPKHRSHGAKQTQGQRTY